VCSGGAGGRLAQPSCRDLRALAFIPPPYECWPRRQRRGSFFDSRQGSCRRRREGREGDSAPADAKAADDAEGVENLRRWGDCVATDMRAALSESIPQFIGGTGWNMSFSHWCSGELLAGGGFRALGPSAKTSQCSLAQLEVNRYSWDRSRLHSREPGARGCHVDITVGFSSRSSGDDGFSSCLLRCVAGRHRRLLHSNCSSGDCAGRFGGGAPAPARPAPTPEQLAVQAAIGEGPSADDGSAGDQGTARGADGDAKSPYAANYDESKADVYPTLPTRWCSRTASE